MKQILTEQLARVLLQVGVNLKEGETVLLQTDTNALSLAREITRQAFELGAKDVQVRIDDPYINYERIKGANSEVLAEASEWEKESIDSVLRDGKGVQLGLMVTYPDLYNDLDTEKLLSFAKMKNDLRNIVRNYIHKGVLKWTGTIYPNLEWAKKVYPELSDDEAYKALEEAICLMMRVDEDSDPVENWKRHCEELSVRSAKLNDYNFKSLHITSELGTDITMDLVKGHIWCSAGEMGEQKVNAPYVANMPTEEVFTDPDFRSVNGIAYASFPLIMSGKLVKDFWIRFENGVAVDCGASENVDVLKDALFKDETTRRLGEVALVSKQSPIRKLGRVFYNGLIDENAACHLALGRPYPENIKGGVDMNKEELKAHGANDSMQHEDFMFGTREMNIDGIQKDGTVVPVFRNGNFVF